MQKEIHRQKRQELKILRQQSFSKRRVDRTESVSKGIVNRRKEVTARVVQMERPSELLEYIKNYLDIQDGVSTSAIATCFAKIINDQKWEGWKKEEGKARLLLKLILTMIDDHIGQMGPRQISNCMWTLGKAYKVLQLEDYVPDFAPVYSKLSERAMSTNSPRQDITSQTMANILWRLGASLLDSTFP
eukprot:TRINITY_DN8534_c0_g1_i3.p1 TRINITY_DN8534_c0_g1~~TRINITY_DN8534_c0_g1_i3.p1  ORF type:complete len:188 (+),score=32.04 TRINITY_DN8534_c0_g1_i3:67-630(+)